VPSADLNFQTAEVVIARSEATKQSIITVALAVDCFASLAMTVVVASLLAMTARLRDLAARFRPSFASSFAALRTEGAGNAGRSMHPQPRVRMKKAHEHSHHGHTGNNPAFPAQWFYGLYRALPGDEFLFVTVTRGLRFCLPGRAD
jgi:hypothetical protein